MCTASKQQHYYCQTYQTTLKIELKNLFVTLLKTKQNKTKHLLESSTERKLAVRELVKEMKNNINIQKFHSYYSKKYKILRTIVDENGHRTFMNKKLKSYQRIMERYLMFLNKNSKYYF